MGLYKKLSRYIHVPIFTGWLIVVAIISWPISKKIGFNYWTTFVGLFVVLAIGGRIITSGDED
jgi:hypothetical protein